MTDKNLYKIHGYDLQVLSESIKDIQCSLCGNIMVEPVVGKCGCQYCKGCVDRMVGSGWNWCPGASDDCRENDLSIAGNVVSNIRALRKLSAIEVQCPFQPCEFKCQVKAIKSHMEICSNKFVECPFSCVGCCQERLNKTNIDRHLQDEIFYHFQLFLLKVMKIRNDFEHLKNEEIKEAKQQISSLNLNSTHSELEEKKQGFELVLDEMEKMKTENNNTLKTIREHVQNHVKRDITVACMKDTVLRKKELDEIILQMESRFKNISQIACELHQEIVDQRHCLHSRLHQNTLVHDGYLWKIPNISKNISSRKQDPINSDSFLTHSNSYCLSLKVYLNGCEKNQGDFLGVFFAVNRGKYDQNLSWPMKHRIFISLINQQTATEHVSICYQYNELHDSSLKYLNRPITARNEHIGNPRLMLTKQLQETEGLIVNDSILFRCVTCG